MRGRSREARVAGWAGLVLLLAASGCSGASPDESRSGPPDASSEASTTPTELPTIDPTSVEMGPACRQEAVVAGAQPYPGDVEQMQALMAIEDLEVPDQAPELRGFYTPIGLDRPWALPSDVNEWDDLNALICVDVVPGSEYVRLECTDQIEGRTTTWEVWGSQLQIRVIDPTTVELVAEDEPFDSDTLLPHLPCGDPPFDIEPGGHGYMADLPPGFVITRERVDAFIRTL
ncbi:MAG: hypothetical protein PIR53_10185 [Nocardioides alkalitolerans]